MKATQKEDFDRLFRHRHFGTMIKNQSIMTQKEDFARLFRHRHSGTMIKNQIYHEINHTWFVFLLFRAWIEG
jgi:hypothetical protein